MKTAQPLYPLSPETAPAMARMAEAWRTSAHIIVIAHPGIRVLTPARHLAAAEPGPVDFADRWLSAVCQSWGSGGVRDGAPFRAPHHTASYVGVFGGGPRGCRRPGECTLAHRGVLYLEQIADFSRAVVHGIAEVLTRREVVIARADGHWSWPACFRLIATAHGCPCGFFGHPTRHCTCTDASIRRHRRRFSALAKRDDVAMVDLNQTRGGHCDPDCRGWIRSHSDNYGWRIEVCDQCNHASATADTYDDDDAERDAAAFVAQAIILKAPGAEVDDVIEALRATCHGRQALADATGAA